MPVPKRQTSRARRDQRQSCKFIRPGQFAQCSNCTQPVGQHRVCGACGFYKGRKVIVTQGERLAVRVAARQKAAAQNVAANSGESA